MENQSEIKNTPSPSPSQDQGSPFYFKQRFKLSALEIMFGLLIVIGLIYIGYFILFQESSGTSTKLQKKINFMETSSREQAGKFDQKIKAIQDNQTQLEVRLKSQEAINRDLSTKVGKLEKRLLEEKKPPVVKEKIQYKVKKGETLQGIAKKFKVSTDELVRWNKLDKNHPARTGDTLIIFPR
ncbi:MAG: LysM peptidoglycan-binding domain-containing protein [Deltaproteobacteria bacterium]|nr:LysM peptidoglycan-binding domain-containing protein [Deltaproteobacteria bacterium]